MSNLIDSITGITPKQKSASVLDEVSRSLHELATQQSSINLEDAVSYGTAEPEKRVSVTVKPVLRSVNVETGDDVDVAVLRLVGGEVKVTMKF